jgi:hypothetical protein
LLLVSIKIKPVGRKRAIFLGRGIMKTAFKLVLATLALGAMVAFSGCTKEEKTVSGVLIGAGTGAAIGGAAGGGGGAAIGAVLGGTAGGVIGHESGHSKKHKKQHDDDDK